MGRAVPRLSGTLPPRFADTEWTPPSRAEEVAALAEAAPTEIIAALSPLVVPTRRERIDQVAQGRLAGVALVLEDLHDPHNGGAALRSCEAVGLCEVHVIQHKDRFRTSSRVTQGCDKWLDVVQHRDTTECLTALRARGFRLYAAVPSAKHRLEELDPLVPAAFLIGNEHAGLTPAARALCDEQFTIPMHGFSESMNLSVATAITLYTHTSRRRAALGRDGDLDEARLAELRARYYVRDVRGAVAIVRRHRQQADAR
jgi:tRNA (guanosine-2'-O-)-methyltransferase